MSSGQLELSLAMTTYTLGIRFLSSCEEKIEDFNIKSASMKAALSGGLSKELPDLNSKENLHLYCLCTEILPCHFGEPCSSSANIAGALSGNVELQLFCAI